MPTNARSRFLEIIFIFSNDVREPELDFLFFQEEEKNIFPTP